MASWRRWDLIWTLKTGCSLELDGGKNFPGGGFCVHKAQSWAVWAIREMELANLKADQIITMKRVVLPSVLGKFLKFM